MVLIPKEGSGPINGLLAASLASKSALSLPSTPQCPGTQTRRTLLCVSRHLGFSNFVNLNSWRVAEVSDASSCQISSKSVKHLQRYQNFSIFQDGGRPPFWICLTHFWTTHEAHLVVFLGVQNLVGIHVVVSIIWNFEYFACLAWKCLFNIYAPKITVLWQFDPLNGEIYQQNPKTAHPCMETHHMTYRSSKSVHWCDLCTTARAQETKKEQRNLPVATGYSSIPPTLSDRNTIWHGWWSSSSSYKFQVSSALAEQLPSCKGSKFGKWSHYLGQWLMQQPYSIRHYGCDDFLQWWILTLDLSYCD